MDRRAWRATVHGAAKEWDTTEGLTHTHTHTHTHIITAIASSYTTVLLPLDLKGELKSHLLGAMFLHSPRWLVVSVYTFSWYTKMYITINH